MSDIGRVSRATLEEYALATAGEFEAAIGERARRALSRLRDEMSPVAEDTTALRMRLANARELLKQVHGALSSGPVDEDVRKTLLFDIEALSGRV